MGFTKSLVLRKPVEISMRTSRNSINFPHEPVNWIPKGLAILFRAAMKSSYCLVLPFHIEKISSRKRLLQNKKLYFWTSFDDRRWVVNSHFTNIFAIQLESGPPVGIPLTDLYQMSLYRMTEFSIENFTISSIKFFWVWSISADSNACSTDLRARF